MAWVPGLGVVRFRPEPRKRRGNLAGALEDVRATREALETAIKRKATERRAEIDRGVCGEELAHEKQAARDVERAERQQARAQRVGRVQKARAKCKTARASNRDAFDRALEALEARARADRAGVRSAYARPPRGEPSPARSKGARRAAETRAERIDLEAQNVDPDLEPLFRKMARQLMSEARRLNARRPNGPQTHAYELFNEWISEHPDSVVDFRERQAEAAVRRLMAGDEEIPF